GPAFRGGDFLWALRSHAARHRRFGSWACSGLAGGTGRGISGTPAGRGHGLSGGYFRDLIPDCTVGTGWAVRSRPPGRPSTSSSLLSWYAGETSAGPATGPTRAGPGFITRLEV